MSLDFGGILPWSRWMMSVAALALAILAWAGYALKRSDSAMVRYEATQGSDAELLSTSAGLIPALLLLLAAGYVAMQMVELPANLVGVLSPGAADAFLRWGQIPGQGPRESFPITVDIDSSRNVLWSLFGTSAFAIAAGFGLRGPVAITSLLFWTALGGAAASAYGMFRMATGDAIVWNAHVSGFGVFVNRNAAALWINLSLASSLGLVAFRSMERFGQEVDDPSFELNDWFGLLSDPVAVVGVLTGLLSIIGLLACGSRGGIAACLIGMLAAMGWIRSNRGFKVVPIVFLATIVVTAVMLVPFRLSMNSLRRFSFFSESRTGTIAEDGRFLHWQDGWDAAKSYFPMGSGAGSYGDAYRPYQSKSPPATFAHADNLWLEWLVEFGLFGALVIAGLSAFLIYQLRRLSESDEPVDHGICVAGWYTLGAVLTAECFNFGLLYMCNALFVIALIAVIASRSCLSASLEYDPQKSGQAEGKFSRFGFRGVCWIGVVPLISLIGCFISVAKLGDDAKVDGAIKSRIASGPTSRLSPDQIRQWTDRLEQLPGRSRLNDALALLYFTQGRRIDLQDQDPRSENESDQLFRATQTTWRRLRWDGTGKIVGPIPLTQPSLQAYEKSLDRALGSLARRPLAIDSRTRLLALDFYHRDVERSTKIYDDLESLVQTNATELFKLGRYAAGSSDVTRARQTWDRVMRLKPKLTSSVLTESTLRGIGLSDWEFPDQSDVALAATAWLVDQTDPDEALLARTTSSIDCEDCESRKEASQCHQVAAEAKLILGSHDAGFKDYQRAITATPMDAGLRFKQIKRLRQYGYSDRALTEAQKSMVIAPEDDRFPRVIREIAAEQLPTSTSKEP